MHIDFDFLRKFFVSDGFSLDFVEFEITNFLSKRLSLSVPQSDAKHYFYISFTNFGSESDKLEGGLTYSFIHHHMVSWTWACIIFRN